ACARGADHARAPARASSRSEGRERPVASSAPARMRDSTSGRVGRARSRKSASDRNGRSPRAATMRAPVASASPKTRLRPTRTAIVRGRLLDAAAGAGGREGAGRLLDAAAGAGGREGGGRLLDAAAGAG